MVVGNAMTAAAVSLNRLGDEMRASAPRIEATLALGATAAQAALPVVRSSLRSGMIPLVDSTKTTGLIFFPGTMVGMLLAGADPVEAVRLQLVLLWTLLGSVAIAALIATSLAYRNFFTPAHQLKDSARRGESEMATTPDTAAPALPIVPSDEEQMLRETVRRSAPASGPTYTRAQGRRGRAADASCGTRSRARGFLGVNLPEEYGGGGLGMSALAAVGEEISAGGCSLLLIVVSPAIVGSILVRHGNEEQKDRWLRGIAAGTTKVAFAITEPGAGSNSHNLSTVGAARQRQLRAARREDLHLGRRGLRRDPGRDARARRRRQPRPAAAVHRRLRRARPRAPAHPDRAARRPTSSGRCSSTTSRCRADRLIGAETGGPEGGLRRAQPRADHGRGGRAAAPGGGRSRWPPTYARERVVWKAPIGAHQGISHPLAQAKIELELARLMTQKAAALYDAGAPAGEASNMAKYAAAEAAIQLRRPGDPDARRQRLRARVRAHRHVLGRAAGAHRAGVARDDPQLRRRALARAAAQLLALGLGVRLGLGAHVHRASHPGPVAAYVPVDAGAEETRFQCPSERDFAPLREAPFGTFVKRMLWRFSPRHFQDDLASCEHLRRARLEIVVLHEHASLGRRAKSGKRSPHRATAPAPEPGDT